MPLFLMRDFHANTKNLFDMSISMQIEFYDRSCF